MKDRQLHVLAVANRPLYRSRLGLNSLAPETLSWIWRLLPRSGEKWYNVVVWLFCPVTRTFADGSYVAFEVFQKASSPSWEPQR